MANRPDFNNIKSIIGSLPENIIHTGITNLPGFGSPTDHAEMAWATQVSRGQSSPGGNLNANHTDIALRRDTTTYTRLSTALERAQHSAPRRWA
jgi:hypothetical protein